MTIIETQNLCFGFSKNTIVIDNLSLKVEEGNIYGFVGPNGAGKSTSIRLLLGLLTPVSGSIKLFGESIRNSPLKIFENIGAMIEAPSLYDHLTGYDNLQITKRIRNIPSKRIKEVLEIVRLEGSAEKKVREYSMGMKQRLGLALALLSGPRLLILDEPANGLDPQGTIETRELLLKLNEDFGTTILISSHLLSEIEKLVTHLGIIKNGQLIFQGTMPELHNVRMSHSSIRLETSDDEKAFSLLKMFCRISYNKENNLQIEYHDREQISQICKTLVCAGVDIFHFHVTTDDLENIFLKMTSN